MRLPRLFRQTDFSQSQIKSAFTHLPSLTRHLLDKPLLSMYASLSLPENARLFLLSWVIADGWGDLMAQMEARRVIAAHFPSLHITSVAFIHKDTTPPFLPCPPDYLYYSGRLNQEIIYEALCPHLQQALSTADLLLEMPTIFPHTDELLATLSQRPRREHLGEHSLIDTPRYYPTSLTRCMGLHPLEKGIFIKERPPQMTYPEGLIDLLFDGHSPSDHHWKRYQQHTAFQVCYIKNYPGMRLYLLTLLSALAHDNRDVDVVIFHLPHLLQLLNTSLLHTGQIREARIYGPTFQSALSLQNEGKRIRFIYMEKLSHAELQTVIGKTEHLIGVTGDQSVLEAIATGTPFLYAPPPFKRDFLRDLIEIAKSVDPMLAGFLTLCLKNPTLPVEDDEQGWVSDAYVEQMEAYLSLEEDTPERIAVTLGQWLQQPTLLAAFTQLKEYLATHHSLHPILCGLVARGIWHQRYPNMIHEEEIFYRQDLQLGYLLDASTPSK